MKNILKFIGLKILEIGSLIYIPYGLGIAGREAFQIPKDNFTIWLEGWLVLLGIILIIAYSAVIFWAATAVLCLIAKALLIWIHWNGAGLAVEIRKYVKLKDYDLVEKKMENAYVYFIGVSQEVVN